jgi:uncharacterized protein with GYD domain
MPIYMTQFAYTPEAKAALAREPEDRSVVFGELVEEMGGQLTAFYHSIGEYDGVAIFEAPDEHTANAIVLAASKPGHIKESKTATLLPVKEAMGAMREASRQEYRGPKGWAAEHHTELWGG